MRVRRVVFRSFVASFAVVPVSVWAQDDLVETQVKTTTVETPVAEPVQAPVRPLVLSTQQIDRFAAIEQVRDTLKTDPKSVADWIILGELAHDVAMDLPEGQDGPYYKLSREAYENALRLDPANNALKAAVAFAKAQEANVRQLDGARRRASTAYLAARRKELAASGNIPTVRSVALPPASRPIAPVAPAAVVEEPEVVVDAPAPAAVAVERPSLYYPPGATYLPFISAQGTPLTYDDYARLYNFDDTVEAPISTVRQTTQTFEPVSIEGATRRATGVLPAQPTPFRNRP